MSNLDSLYNKEFYQIKEKFNSHESSIDLHEVSLDSDSEIYYKPSYYHKIYSVENPLKVIELENNNLKITFVKKTPLKLPNPNTFRVHDIGMVTMTTLGINYSSDNIVKSLVDSIKGLKVHSYIFDSSKDSSVLNELWAYYNKKDYDVTLIHIFNNTIVIRLYNYNSQQHDTHYYNMLFTTNNEYVENESVNTDVEITFVKII